MGELLAQLVAGATGAIRRRVIVYGLWFAAGLLLIFAAGYAVNGLHALLISWWGAIAASLAVAGGLLLCSIVLVVVGHLLSRRRSTSLYQRLEASPEFSRTAKYRARPKQKLPPVAAGAVAGAVTVITLTLLRRNMSLRDGSRGKAQLATLR